MATVTLLQDGSATLWYHEEGGIVHHKTHGYLPPGTFIKLLAKGADCLEQHKLKKWLSDDREHTVLSKEDNEWGDTVWAPRVIKAGFKYWAVLPPAAAVGAMQMQRFIEEYKRRGVTVRTFTDLDDGLDWLRSCK